jgi:20S proteasome alpha/beta subunit
MKIDELIETLPELTSEDKVKKIITIQSEMIRVSTGFNGDCEELPNYVFNALLEAFDKVNTLSEAEKKT